MLVSTRDRTATRRAAALTSYRRVAMLLFVALYLADGVLTLIGQAHDAPEDNPLMRPLLHAAPLVWFALFKLLLTPIACWGFAASLRVWPRRTVAVSLFVLAEYAWVVVHNLAYLG